MIFRVSKSKSVKRAFVFSFLITFIIPVFCNIFVLFNNKNVMKESIYDYNAAAMQQLSYILDGYLKTIDIISYQIANDEKLQELITESMESKRNDSSKHIELSEYLKNYKHMSSVIQDVCIYINSADKVVTSSLCTDSKSFFYNNYLFESYEYSAWYDTFLDTYSYQRYFGNIRCTLVNKTENLIVYKQSMPVVPNGKIQAQLIIMVNADEIMNIMSKGDNLKGTKSYIIDNIGNVIISTANESEISKNVLRNIQNDKEGIFEIKIDKKPYVVLYSNSSQLKWSYVTYIPVNIFLQNLSRINIIALISYSICFSLGICIIWFFGKKSYKPIKNILTNMRVNGSGKFDSGNEYDYINQNIIESSKRADDLKSIIENKNDALKNEYLVGLLKGNIDGKQLNSEKFREIDFPVNNDEYALIYIYIENSEDIFSIEVTKEYEMIKFIIRNVLTELLAENSEVHSVELEYRRLAFIINSDNGYCKRADKLNEIAEVLTNLMKNEFEIGIFVAISKAHKGAENLKSCYIEVKELSNYRSVFDNNPIMNYYEFENNGFKNRYFNYCYSSEMENKVINICSSGKRNELENIIDEIYSANSELIARNPRLMRCLYFDIYGTYMKIVNNFYDTNKDFENLDFEEKYNDTASPEVLFEYLKSAFGELCDLIDKSLKTSKSMLDEIKDYIAANYMNYDMGLDSISEKFDITPKYLSNYFKKYERVKLIDFITDLRMEKAKEFLVSTDLSMGEIAEMVGYSSDIVFSRSFKKKEGVPPGMYRSINMQ